MRTIALVRLARSLAANRGIVLDLALQQLRRRYVGTLGGLGWTVLQPLVLIATYWVVFALGFRVTIGDGAVSFTAYFVTGTAAWLLISEAISAGVGSVTGHSHLVKKVVFPIEALPVAPVMMAAILHLVLLAIVLAYLLIERHMLPWTVLQLPYYTICALSLCAGLVLLTSALQVFFRDVQKLVETVLGVWFWASAVVWPADLVPAAWRWLLDANPAWYIVNGYRDSLIYGVAVWERPWQTAVFWAMTGGLLVAGAWVFQRLKSEFAEVM